MKKQTVRKKDGKKGGDPGKPVDEPVQFRLVWGKLNGASQMRRTRPLYVSHQTQDNPPVYSHDSTSQ